MGIRVVIHAPQARFTQSKTQTNKTPQRPNPPKHAQRCISHPNKTTTRITLPKNKKDTHFYTQHASPSPADPAPPPSLFSPHPPPHPHSHSHDYDSQAPNSYQAEHSVDDAVDVVAVVCGKTGYCTLRSDSGGHRVLQIQHISYVLGGRGGETKLT